MQLSRVKSMQEGPVTCLSISPISVQWMRFLQCSGFQVPLRVQSIAFRVLGYVLFEGCPPAWAVPADAVGSGGPGRNHCRRTVSFAHGFRSANVMIVRKGLCRLKLLAEYRVTRHAVCLRKHLVILRPTCWIFLVMSTANSD